MQISKQRHVASLMGRCLIWATGFSSTLMVASPGLGQGADSAGIGAKPPKNTVITTINVGKDPAAIAVSPDNKTVYVGSDGSNSVTVLDATNNYAVKATISPTLAPYNLALSPDGTTLYVSSPGSPGVVYVFDTTQSTYPLKATLTAVAYAEDLAVTPDGKELYVANLGYLNQGGAPGSVTVFDTSTNTLKTTLQTGGGPSQSYSQNKGSKRTY
jgi:YVTN family beta-propeller protein